MTAFDIKEFVCHLLAAALMYDQEYDVIPTVGLIDPAARKEIYLASFSPEDGVFVIEEATLWEPDTNGEDASDVIGYELAVDSLEYGIYDTPAEAAETLFALAQNEGLLPDITLIHEDDIGA